MPPRIPKDSTVWPYNLCLPGALLPAIGRRIEELKSGNLSRYIIELIAYDLRELRAHSLTARVARKILPMQQAVDLAIARHYTPGKRSNREQMDDVIKGTMAAPIPPFDPAVLKKEKHRVYLRSLHREAMNQRLQSLHFRNLSEYITSLIRYDLLVGGPHRQFPPDDHLDRKAIAALDRHTLETFQKNKPRKCLIDYLVEEAAGRKMTPEERDAELEKVAEQLCTQAVEVQKRARKGR